MEDLLPIGSIVQLKNKKRKMIIGYLPNKPNDLDFNEYVCCNSKVGFVKPKDNLEFNKDYVYIKNDDIETVLYIGCQDDSFLIYQLVHNKVKEALLEARKNKEMLSEEDISEIYSNIVKDLKIEKENPNEE